MNLVLGDAIELSLKHKLRTEHGRLLLKGDSITLITEAKGSEDDTEAGAPVAMDD